MVNYKVLDSVILL